MPRLRIRGWLNAPRFALCALVAVLPVIALGVILAASFRSEARTRELATAMYLSQPPNQAPAPGADRPPGARPLTASTMDRTMSRLRRFDAAESHQTSQLLGALERELALGLAGLYLVLLLLAALAVARSRRDAARTAFLAGHDVLTGLPNRSAFTNAAAEVLAAGRGSGASTALAILNLDRFTSINDTLSHRVGDLVLCQLATRLAAELGPGDVVARLGGDEFGVALSAGEHAAQTLAHLREVLGAELAVAGLTVSVPASVGYALAPGDGESVGRLLQRADIALCDAKRRHCGLVRWDAALDREDAENLSLATELHHAIDEEQLVLHYQPQVDPRTGQVSAVEALVRWQHPARGLLFPDRFLSLAEQTDDIERLTAWVLRRALRDVRTLAPGPSGPRVAVNISPRSLGRGELADEVLAALRELEMEPERLIIEVTETAILVDPERAAGELERLASAGVWVSLDDFGRGQTSIGHFSSLPLHELKIDRCFVGDMDADLTHAAIVRSLVELGHNLGLQVVAEGVEDDTVRDRVSEAGADLIQGYLLTRPLPLEEVRAWLTDHAGARPPVTDAQGSTAKVTLAR